MINCALSMHPSGSGSVVGVIPSSRQKHSVPIATSEHASDMQYSSVSAQLATVTLETSRASSPSQFCASTPPVDASAGISLERKSTMLSVTARSSPVKSLMMMRPS